MYIYIHYIFAGVPLEISRELNLGALSPSFLWLLKGQTILKRRKPDPGSKKHLCFSFLIIFHTYFSFYIIRLTLSVVYLLKFRYYQLKLRKTYPPKMVWPAVFFMKWSGDRFIKCLFRKMVPTCYYSGPALIK